MSTWFTRYRSPIGRLTLSKSRDALERLDLDLGLGRSTVGWREDARAFAPELEWLESYFAGKQPRGTLALDLRGTPFQVSVWRALRRIPYGRTTTYAAIARAIGRPDAVRAVGGANHHNPTAIIVPCHRVIGSNGSLVGYGGGLPTKKWLLAHEGARAAS
jgi:methylated-DNA-[protein]-cysteine S-methyltransferase